MTASVPLLRLKLPHALQNCRMPQAHAMWITEALLAGLESQEVRDRIGSLGIQKVYEILKTLTTPETIKHEERK